MLILTLTNSIGYSGRLPRDEAAFSVLSLRDFYTPQHKFSCLKTKRSHRIGHPIDIKMLPPPNRIHIKKAY